MYLRLLMVLALGPMCTGDILYIQEEHLPPGAASGAKQLSSRALESTIILKPRNAMLAVLGRLAALVRAVSHGERRRPRIGRRSCLD